MNTSNTFRQCLLGLGIGMLAISTQAAETDIAQTPLVVATPNAVQPNLMFVLDDSGSMGFDFMPDHVAGNGSGIYPKQCRTTGATSNNSGSFNTTCCQGGDSSNVCLSGTAPTFGNKRAHPPFLSASYNTMAYNPATVYKPPINGNGSSWPSMTSANTSAWQSVPDDAFRVQTSSNTNLLTQFPDVSWCTSNSYTDCLRNGNYVLPGKVGSSNYTVYLATSASSSGFKAVGSPDSPTKVAQDWGPHYYNIIPAEYCTKADLRVCRVGQNASYTFPAPVRWCNSTANAAAAVSNGSCQAVRTNTYQYARYPTRQLAASSNFPGSFERVDIVPSRTTYPRAATRTDCLDASSCSYAEEMTNFANWWAYYRTRMQMMKSSTSQAFGAVSADYRVGYLTINNAQSNGFLNLKTFSGGDKNTWYTRLFAAKPSGSTPLRAALQTVGQLYGGKRTGTLNGSAIVDPIQYSCQGNYTILSTDGFWNESVTLKQLNGTTDLGDQDGGLDRPMKDGNSTANTLADAASYYYRTDLRNGQNGVSCTSGSGTGADVCSNGTANAKPQKMTTFTLGLGASGYMQYLPGYQTATEGDFHAVKNGVTPDAAAGVCSWQTSGQCTWPSPVSNELTTIDDLWHAAVNGGGSYFSAAEPSSLYTGLTTALASIDAELGTSAGASVSNPNISAGSNQIFLSTFTSGEWSGELKEQRIDPNTGSIGAAVSWSASALLDRRASRTIYMYDGSVASKRKSFEWGSLSASEKAFFQLPHVTAAGRALTQFCGFGAHCLSPADQSTAAGSTLLSYLRGDRSNEGAMNVPSKYFRARAHVLGDIVSSEAVYVNKPQLNLVDAGYEDFKASPAIAGRPGMVYVGANDGMLHAFVAATGEEAWAYVPTAVLPKLYKLADKSYGNKHEYFVDGTPVVEDVVINGQWRTLLVAGLGAGGRAYYALDVTDPADPKPLWEFSHANLGYTIGKPEIAKLANGRWVVFAASGYNNVSPGDGVGRLFVLDASTGQPVAEMPNGIKTTAGGADVGSVSTPSGLGHIRTWVEKADRDSTVLRVYGGDSLGNVWRFDVNNTIGAAGYDAQRLATLKNAGGFPQPVTSRPEVGEVPGAYGRNHAMVFVGTGRYLGVSDITDSTVQSIYGIKDRLNDSDYLNPRAATNAFVKQTLVTGSCPANSTICTVGMSTRNIENPQPVDLEVKDGWYVDLPITRERVNTDPVLVQGVLTVVSNVVDASGVCTVGGSSWINYFDYRTGAAAPSANGVVSLFLGEALATRPIVINVNGKLRDIIKLGNGTVENNQPTRTRNLPADRISWRELSVE